MDQGGSCCSSSPGVSRRSRRCVPCFHLIPKGPQRGRQAPSAGEAEALQLLLLLLDSSLVDLLERPGVFP